MEDDKGRTMPAMKVFTEVIRYLKSHLFELLEKRGTQITEDDVHFILTVPAIWTDYAKQFMREAASEVRLLPIYLLSISRTVMTFAAPEERVF